MFLTELNVLRTYLRLLVFPVNQMHEYGYPVVQRFAEPGTLFSIGLLAAVVGMGLRLYQKNRLLSFTVFWFLSRHPLRCWSSARSIAPPFMNTGFICRWWGFLFWGCGVGTSLPGGREIKAGGVFLIFMLSVLTYQRNFVWQNEILFGRTGLTRRRTSRTFTWHPGWRISANIFSQAYQKYRDGLRLYDGHRAPDSDAAAHLRPYFK